MQEKAKTIEELERIKLNWEILHLKKQTESLAIKWWRNPKFLGVALPFVSVLLTLYVQDYLNDERLELKETTEELRSQYKAAADSLVEMVQLLDIETANKEQINTELANMNSDLRSQIERFEKIDNLNVRLDRRLNQSTNDLASCERRLDLETLTTTRQEARIAILELDIYHLRERIKGN